MKLMWKYLSYKLSIWSKPALQWIYCIQWVLVTERRASGWIAPVRESGFPNSEMEWDEQWNNFFLWKLGSWALQSGKQFKESGIPQRLALGTLDERRSHPESKTVLDFLTRFRGELKFRLEKYAANNNLSKIKTTFSLPLTDFYFTI